MESDAPSNMLEDGNAVQESSFDKSNEREKSSPLDGDNGNPEDSKSQHDKQIEDVCIFCQQNEDNEFKFGKLCRLEDASNGRMITAHHYCLFFASGLCQKGSDNEGIQGFLASDIQKEVYRAARLKCSFCTKKGASVGCCIKKCRQCYHYPCGRENGSLFRFYDDFVSFCSTHRPRQDFTSAEGMNVSLVNCPVCLDEVPNEPSFDVLKTPCCHNTFLHRDCIQQQALASGYYFFRCPICNNQKEFRDEMRSFGIHVPEQDAAWEREEGAFQELYQRHNRCDVEDCLCPKGNDHSTSQGKWQIVLCDFCGSVGCHVECGRLERPSQDWACSMCRGMLSTGASNGLLFESTPCKKKGRARSAMKFKGKTPRAGIKNKKVKKSTGTTEVDVDRDSPSTSRDGITDDYDSARKKTKKKTKDKNMKKGDKKKSKSSEPPTLTRADLSPVRPVLPGDGPKTPKLSPMWNIWGKVAIGKQHSSKGFKRHTFGMHSSSKLKGQSMFLKTTQSQKQKHLKGESKSGKVSQTTGKERLPLSTTSGGEQDSLVKNPEVYSGGKKKVPKSQHAVIFQSQSKLFKSGFPVKTKQDLASSFMNRSLATVKGQLVSNLPLIRLCKMVLAEGGDTEQVQASSWKRALVSTTQQMLKKNEAGSEGTRKVHYSRMSMKKRLDKKICATLKKKSEQVVIRSTRSKVNDEELTNDILKESAKNILHAVLTGSKPVDLGKYLHHRSKSEEIISDERLGEKGELANPPVALEGNESKDLAATEASTFDEIKIYSPKKLEEKYDVVDLNESEVKGSETEKKECLRSFSKSSDSLANRCTRGQLEQKVNGSVTQEEHTEVEDGKSPYLPPSSDSVHKKMAQESLSVKAIDTRGLRSSPRFGSPSKVSFCQNSSAMKKKEIELEGEKSLHLHPSSGNVHKKIAQESLSVKAVDTSGLGSSPRFGSSSKVPSCQNDSTMKSKQVEEEDEKSPNLPHSSDNVHKHIAQELISVKAVDTSGLRSSPTFGSSSKVSSCQNDTTMKNKQNDVEDSESSHLPYSSDKSQKKMADDSISVNISLGSSSNQASFQNKNENMMKDFEVTIEEGKSSPLPDSSPQMTRSSPQKELNTTYPQGTTTEVSGNLPSHLVPGNLRSSPRLRSQQVHDGAQKPATDVLLKCKEKPPKPPLNEEQKKTLVKENGDALDHATGRPIVVSPVSEDSDQTCTDSQTDEPRDVSIIAVFSNKEKDKASPQTNCQMETKSDKKGKDDFSSRKRQIDQQSPKTESGMLRKVLKSNLESSEDTYKQKKMDSSKSILQKDSFDERLAGKLARHSKGKATGHKRSSSDCSGDIAILGVYKTEPSSQRKIKVQVLNQVQTKEKRSTPLLRSEKRKRAKSDSRDEGQESLKVNTGTAKEKGSSTSPGNSSCQEAIDESKPKAKKTLNDYFQATDKKPQQSGNDVKITASSVVRNVPNLLPVVKTNVFSHTKPVSKTNTSVAKVKSSVVKTNPASQTKPTEDVTILGIFKKRNMKDSHKQSHVPNTSKDTYNDQQRGNTSATDLSSNKLQDTKKVGKVLGTSTASSRNSSKVVRMFDNEIMAEGLVKTEPRQTPDRQHSSRVTISQYVLSSGYVSRTPSPQKRRSNHFYSTSQYSWPLTKRELDMDVVILDAEDSSARQVNSRARLLTDSIKKSQSITNETNLKFSSPRKQPSSDSCKERETNTLVATRPKGKSSNASEILSSKRKQPSKRKCSEMEVGGASAGEPLPNKENSNLEDNALNDDEKAGLSFAKGEMGKEDSISKRRSKRLRKDESLGNEVYDLTEEEDIFPKSQNKASQKSQLNEMNLQDCKATEKVHGKATMDYMETRQSTPQKRVLLQRPLSLCKGVDGEGEGEVARSTRRKCNSDLKVKRPLTVQKISRRQLVM